MSNRRRPVHPAPLLVPLVATLVAAPLHLCGQSASTAGLRGRIVDTQGAPVEAALVTLTHTGSGATGKALSVAGGRFPPRGRRPPSRPPPPSHSIK